MRHDRRGLKRGPQPATLSPDPNLGESQLLGLILGVFQFSLISEGFSFEFIQSRNYRHVSINVNLYVLELDAGAGNAT